MRRIAWQFLAVAVVFLVFASSAPADINEGFDNFQNGVRPRGWSFAYCDQNSDGNTVHFGNSAPSVTLDAYGDLITTITFNPSTSQTVEFFLEALASNPSSAFMVRESPDDGTTWNRVTMIYGIPNIGVTYGPLALNPSGSSQVEFSYKDPANNTDLYLDDVVITNAATPEPSPTPVSEPTPIYLAVDWDDFDGNGTSDIGVYDPSTGEWDIRDVTSGVIWGGASGDLAVPGDYDGDLIADLAYFNRFSGQWSVRGITSVQWGAFGDIPVPGDYDGDGTADFATWRPSDGKWRIKDVSDVKYGGEVAGMIPVPGDYNGDGTTDLAVLYPQSAGGTGTWYVKDIRNRFWFVDGAVPRPMDYNGDGTADLGFYRPSNGKWYVRNLADGANNNIVGWGIDGDISVVGDFDGDGFADPTAFRPSISRWWIRYSAGSPGFVDFSAQSTDSIVDGATSY